MVWYENDKPSQEDLPKLLGPAPDGRTASSDILKHWHTLDSWDQRADVLDAKASNIIDDEMIKRRVEMLKTHSEIGQEMARKGRVFLQNTAFESASEAIRAIVEGTKLERQSAGLAETLSKVLTASDDELNQMAKKYLNSGEIVEGEVKENDEEKESDA